MSTEENFAKLEQEERDKTDESLATMIALLSYLRSELESLLRNFYSMYGKDGVITYSETRKWISKSDHRRRLTVLITTINEQFDELLKALTPEFREMLLKVIKAESDFFRLPTDPEKILNEGWGTDSENWSDRLSNDVALWCAYILSDIKRAFVKCNTLDATLTQISKRFNYIEHVLTTLGLSESTAVGSIARRELFKELGITKYQFYTKPDERRCETCGSMHGLVFPISAYEVGVTASPIHPRCRCWEVPIVD